MASSKRLKLGDTYVDAISGFKGVAVIRYTRLNGRTDVAIDGGVDEKGNKRKHEYFDAESLRTEKGDPITLPALPKSDLQLGKEYRDDISDFVGITTARADHVNGCVQYALDPKIDDKGNMRAGYMFDDARLVDVETEKKTNTPAPRGSADLEPSR